MLAPFSPAARRLLILRLWLFSHGFFWLDLHLKQIICIAIIYVPSHRGDGARTRVCP